MSRIRAYLKLSTVLIVSAVAGCDNVEWGGVELSVVPPAPKAEPADARPADATALPQGPILFYVRPAPDRLGGTAIPVAEVSGDSLLHIGPWDAPRLTGERFMARSMPEGEELTLFRRGKRAGTLVIQQAHIPENGACRLLPVAEGALELGRLGRDADEFLAMSRTDAPAARVAPGEDSVPDRRVRVTAPILAERLLRARRARLPDDWDRARAQLEAFPVPGSVDPAFTATFLVHDTLGPGLDNRGHALHFLGVPHAQVGYDTVYVRYTAYRESGKAAPRVVDFLDWDRDGTVDLLLQVYGIDDAWFEAVSTVDGRWRRVLVDRCETAGRP